MNSLKKLIQETLAELTQNPPVTYLFHGTSDKHLDSIMAQGLREPYLTSDYTKAGYYATEVSEEVGGEPIILKVKIPDQSKLRVDYNELDEPVDTSKQLIQQAYKKYIKENPKSYDKKHDIISVDKKDYWVSLTTTRTVWYEGIIPFENISFDGNNYLEEATSKKTITLYHGTNYPQVLEGNDWIFFSTKKDFAESYGNLIFECQVNVGKVFKSWDPQNIKKLYAAGFKLTDDYITSAYGPDDEIAQFYDFENDYYPTAESFINGPFFGSDTWEAIEHTHGVVDWIFGSGYDSIAILEGGVLNYYTSADRIVSKKQLKKKDRTKELEDFFWKQNNESITEGHYTTWKKIEESSPIDQFEGTEQEIAQKLAKHFNIGRISPLGSGTSGFAYYIPNNRVLKITKDKTEVAEAYKIKGKKLKHLANVYGAYELRGKYAGTYVIISELLDYSEDIDYADQYLKDVLSEDHYQEELYYRNPYQLLTRIFYGMVSDEQISQIKEDIPVYLKSHQAQVALWYLNGMLAIFKELKKHNIQSSDWGHQNLGVKKDGSLAMFDLGYGDKAMPAKVKSINLNEKTLTQIQTFSDLSYSELAQIAQWGLEGEFSMSGCWDEAGEDLLKAIECAVGDFTLFLKDKYPQGFNDFPNEPILYRFITAPNKESINIRKLGQSWFADPNQYKNNTEFFGQLMHLRKRERPEGHKLFLISAKVPMSSIDIRRTLWQRSANWNENEVVLNNDYDLNIVDIKDMTSELGESYGLSEEVEFKRGRYQTKDGTAYAEVEKQTDRWHIAMIESKKPGNGTLLVKRIIEDAKKAGVKKITLTTTEFSGWGFFDKLGFTEVGDNNDPHDIPMEMNLGEDFKHLKANEYPDFFDGQNNPLFHSRAYPAKMNISAGQMREAEIGQEELNKKTLPYKHADMFDDFLIQKTEEEIREIAPTINLNRAPVLIVKDLEDNYPSLFDNFADWIFSMKK